EADHEAGVAEADLGDELLEAAAVAAAGAGFAEVFVDDLDPFTRPAEPDGAVDEPVLELGALPMMLHLVHRRLADVDVGPLGAMRRADLFVRGERGQHGGAPPSQRSRTSFDASARQEPAPLGPASG